MPSRGRILIVDDDAPTRTHLVSMLRNAGFCTEMAADGFKGLHKFAEFAPELVLVDRHMPGMDGLDFIQKVRQLAPSTALIVMTERGSISEAVQVVQSGAADYLQKPIEETRLASVLERVLVQSRALQQSHGRRNALREDAAFEKIVGEHPGILSLLKLVKQIAPSRASVLLEGESGTGKGLFAEAIHRASLRADRPFVRLSCAELTESLLESEIFGHEKGAFTGAISRRDGRFKQADGGTLFLDEVSEIPLATQVKLLRFMQERTFERVGGNETIRVDVRIIAATNRPLKSCVDAGSFRMDLYYRLNVVPLQVPPLRERLADIPLLAGHFLRHFAEENGRSVEEFSEESLQRLMSYGWPGNARELENVIERAVVLCDSDRIEPWHLPSHIGTTPTKDGAPTVPGATLQDIERWAILQTLKACGGSTSRAATILGISPRKIQYKLHEYAGLGPNGGRSRSSPPDSAESALGEPESVEGKTQ